MDQSTHRPESRETDASRSQDFVPTAWRTGCRSLVLATGNRDKVAEFARLLAPLEIPLKSLVDFPATPVVVESGATLAENARLKASAVALSLGTWALADDTGLEVDALGGAPGVWTARYAGPRASMEENRAKLLAQLCDVPVARRAARFVCRLAVADPSGAIVAESEGICRGRVLTSPRGGAGFGYDALFEVDGLGRTLAELSPEETADAGHRGRAVRCLLAGR